jgi:hypothetical protein
MSIIEDPPNRNFYHCGIQLQEGERLPNGAYLINKYWCGSRSAATNVHLMLASPLTIPAPPYAQWTEFIHEGITTGHT